MEGLPRQIEATGLCSLPLVQASGSPAHGVFRHRSIKGECASLLTTGCCSFIDSFFFYMRFLIYSLTTLVSYKRSSNYEEKLCVCVGVDGWMCLCFCNK